MFPPIDDLKPAIEVLKEFNIQGDARLLVGGLNRCFRVGNVVLKYLPETSEAEASWLPELLNNLDSDTYRVQKYLQTREGKFIYEGWTAYEFLAGVHENGRLKEKRKVLEAFHKDIEKVPLPPHLQIDRKDPWSMADKMVWDETPIECHVRIKDAIQKLIKIKEPLKLRKQLIQGDPNHILFSENELPALIDLSWHWAPADFSLAVLAADHLVCWCHPRCVCLPRSEVVKVFEDIKHFKQLLIRAVMRRALELEGLRIFNEKFLYEIDNHKPAIDFVYDYIKNN